MTARLRSGFGSPDLLVIATAIMAAAVGLLCGVKPAYGILVAVGLGVVVVVFADLPIGFAVMAMIAFLEQLATVHGISLAKVIGAVLVASWFGVIGAGRAQARNIFVDSPVIGFSLIAFIGYNTMSIEWSGVQGAAVTSVTRYVLNAVLIPIAYAAMRDRRDALRVLAAIVIGATIAGLSGIASPPPATASDFGRATGTIGDANELAAALVLGLCVAGAFAVNRRVAAPARLAACFATAVCLLGIFLSLSRGGLLGLAGAMAAAVVFGGRWRGRVMVVAAGIVTIGIGYFALVASLPARERVTNAGGGTGRLDLWTIAERMISAHPFRGVGTGQFQYASVHYLLRPGVIHRADFILSTPKVAHNTYLNVVAEVGLIGGILFLILVIGSVWSCWEAVRRFHELGDEVMEIMARGVLVGSVGFLVTLLFISENTSKLLWLMLALGPALLAVARSIAPREPAAP